MKRRSAKLTLSADEDTIRTAHELAKSRKTSVSAMFTSYVRGLSEVPEHEIGPLTRKAIGLVKMPRGKSDQDVLADALLEKHGFR